MFKSTISAVLSSALQFEAMRPMIFGNKTGPGVRNWHKRSGSIATANRHTGKPHEHSREIARRLRQQGASA